MNDNSSHLEFNIQCKGRKKSNTVRGKNILLKQFTRGASNTRLVKDLKNRYLGVECEDAFALRLAALR